MDARRVEDWNASGTTTTPSEGAPKALHRLVVDHSERCSALLEAVRRSGWCDVRMARLRTGDYLVNGQV